MKTMLIANAKKIKSALKGPFYLVIFIAVFFVCAVVLWLSQGGSRKDLRAPSNQSGKNTVYCLRTAEQSDGTRQQKCDYPLEAADKREKRQIGLSGRENLKANTGMIFVFERPSTQCMWMKDMRFSLDMLWLNKRREIIKIERNVRPESFPATYCSPNTKYVIELNSGEADRLRLAQGTKLQL